MNSCFVYSGPLVSVIVPAYNVGKYLHKCIDSILSQTYKNIEIIIVDDGATDNTSKIIKEYESKYPNVRLVKHAKNMGLFKTRITGVEAANGEYIVFVDGDDYISVDWIRGLLKCALKYDLDMVIGEFAFDPYGYPNLDPMRIYDYELEGDAVFEEFLKQADSSFSFHVIWNKLYRKELWNKGLPTLKAFAEGHEHFTMWEDVVFTSLMWKNSRRVKNIHGYYYYYYKGDLSSATNSVNNNKGIIEKYISDASSAVKFIESLINEDNDNQMKYYDAWKANAASIVYYSLRDNKDLYEQRIREAFEFSGKYSSSSCLDYVITNCTVSDGKFELKEKIKSAICANATKIVSFDVFDTLVMRPYLYPTDLFYDLSHKFNEDFSSFTNFYQIRAEAEVDCRKTLEKASEVDAEDITLEDIYDLISNRYCIDKAKILKTMYSEQQMEIDCSEVREFGKGLFELAKDAGKNIVITSDMYLPKETIERILRKNGYEGYDKLYVSSEIKLTKGSGKLYKCLLNDNPGIDYEDIVHIGDNICSDYTMPKTLGINAFYVPNVFDCFTGNAAGYSGNLFKHVFGNNGWYEDIHALYKWAPSLRNLIAVFINKIFDDPYITHNSWSDFNMDPRIIGYSALGPHILAVVNWLIENAVTDNVRKIHFVARDGYVIKETFDFLNNTSVESGYIRVSRKAIILADVNSLEDLYSLNKKINVLSLPPKKIIKYIEPIIKDAVKTEDIKNAFQEEKIAFDEILKNEETYAKCMKILIQRFLDESKLYAYKKKLRDYFSSFIKEGDCIFDIGYNGRVEAALTSLLGYKVGVYYIHTNDDTAMERHSKHELRCRTFYQVKPCITGVVRELMLMERGPSTIGFAEKNGTMEPILEKYEPLYMEELVTKVIQENALDYVRDYEKSFGNRNYKYSFNYIAASTPLEYLLEYSSEYDKRVFKIHRFEDDANGEHDMSVYDFWIRESEWHNLNMNKVNHLGETPEEELTRVYNSATYRIGAAIMCIPKAIRHAIQKL